MKVPYIPMADWMIGRMLKSSTKTKSGLHVPVETSNNLAKIVKRGVNCSIKVNTTVVYRDCETLDEYFIGLQEADILATVEESPSG